MHRDWVWLWGLGLLACSPNATGAGSSSANTLGEGPSDPATTGDPTTSSEAETGIGDATGGSGPASTTMASTGPGSLDTSGSMDDSSSGEPPSPALLVIEGAPEPYDFGDVPTGGVDQTTLTVTNTGKGDATGVSGLPLPAPFGYPGGTFPGLAGDCGDTLAVDDACTVEISFSPGQVGLQEGTLAIAYDGAADATRPLVGGGTGQSGNLLLNPGGEDQGSPPPQWNDTGPGSWVAGLLLSETGTVEGVSYHYADSGPNNQAYVLRQDVDVSGWATTIDQGLMRFSFAGWARALELYNDDYRMRVFYRDAGGTNLDSYNTSWFTSSSWQSYADDRIAPAGTREIRVDLSCRKSSGNWCNAYFDALELRASYPP